MMMTARKLFRHRLRQLVAGLGATLLALALVSCAGSQSGEPVSAEGQRGSPAGDEKPYRLSLEVSPPSVRAPEPVTFTLGLEANRELVLQFGSGQRYDFEVTDGAGKPVWKWSDGQFFVQSVSKERLGPGERLTYRAEWVPERAGSYRVRGVIMADRPDLAVEVPFTVS